MLHVQYTIHYNVHRFYNDLQNITNYMTNQNNNMLLVFLSKILIFCFSRFN